MADTDHELKRLEYQFQICLHALKAEMPPHLIERLTSLARRQALNYASEQSRLQTGLPILEGDLLQQFMQRYTSQPPPGSATDFRRPTGKFDVAQQDRESARPSIFPKRLKALLFKDTAEPMVGAEASEDLFGDRTSIDVARLQGRDRETWLQRIAELTLQGETGRAEGLLATFNRRFG